jgi:uncharacterized phiE125 gp8 family phage protein
MLQLITSPAVEPLTATECRARGRISSDVEDETIDACIVAFRAALDGAGGLLGRAINTQTWELVLPCFPCDAVDIPLPPVQSVTSVKYLDETGTERTLDASDYALLTVGYPLLVPAYGQRWPVTARRADAVRVRFVCGYGDAGDDVPETIRQAIILQVASMCSTIIMGTKSQEAVTGVGSVAWASPDKNAIVVDRAVDALLGTLKVPHSY